jgi:phage baseplate assembly protein V
MSDAYDLGELDRRLANIVRIGTIAQLDEVNAQVKVKIDDGLTTAWLPWVTARAGNTRTWSAPRVGEQVVLMAPSGELDQGVVLPSIYQDSYGAPASSKDQETTVYPDGTTVDYNSATNTFTMTVAGAARVIVNCKEATVNAETSVTLATPLVQMNTDQCNVSGNLTVDGLFEYKGGLIGSGGAGSTATINGNITVDGNISATGNMSAGGSMTDGDGDGGA